MPTYQMWAGKHVLLPLWCAWWPPRRVPEVFERQAGRLLLIGEGMASRDRVRRVLVPRQIGLEDSSRFHSWSMIVEHLTIVGDRIAGVLLHLSEGRTPAGEVRTADLKPPAGTSPDQAVSAYQAMLRRFRRVVMEQCGDWSSTTLYPHPWFGPLGIRQWACFAPFHQAIHLKQARRIRARLPRDRGAAPGDRPA